MFTAFECEMQDNSVMRFEEINKVEMLSCQFVAHIQFWQVTERPIIP